MPITSKILTLNERRNATCARRRDGSENQRLATQAPKPERILLNTPVGVRQRHANWRVANGNIEIDPTRRACGRSRPVVAVRGKRQRDHLRRQLGSGAPTLQTLTYALLAITPDPITGVFVNAALTVGGVSMNIIGPQFDTTPATGYGGPLWLQFMLAEGGASNAFIYTGSCSGDLALFCTPNTNLPSNPAPIRISVFQAPERGSLALLFGAVVGGVLTRRLRKK